MPLTAQLDHVQQSFEERKGWNQNVFEIFIPFFVGVRSHEEGNVVGNELVINLKRQVQERESLQLITRSTSLQFN